MDFKKSINRLLFIFIFSYSCFANAELGFTVGLGINGTMKAYRISGNATSPLGISSYFLPLTEYWEASFIHIGGNKPAYYRSSMIGGSILYNFRFEKFYEICGISPYFDAGFGLAAFNKERIVERSLGNHLLAETKLGAGLQFFKIRNSPVYIGYQYIHNSNGNFFTPNDALNMHYIVFNLWF